MSLRVKSISVSMSKGTGAMKYLQRALGWEKAIVILSGCIATGIFLAVYVLGNAASHWGDGNPVDLSTAGAWFLRALVGFAGVGTVINILHLLISVVSNSLRRKAS